MHPTSLGLSTEENENDDDDEEEEEKDGNDPAADSGDSDDVELEAVHGSAELPEEGPGEREWATERPWRRFEGVLYISGGGGGGGLCITVGLS